MTGRWGILAICCVVVAAAAIDAAGGHARVAAAQDFPVATDARIGGDENQTRFIIDLNQKIELHAFTLADPYRVVVDLPQVTFQLPPKVGEKGRGLVKAFRFGLVMAGGSRIVIDLAKPARLDKAFVLEPGQGQPGRLVLDLVATDRESFMRDLKKENRAARPASPAAGTISPSPQASADPRPIVVVDPGHGGIDSGAETAAGDTEKSIVLDFGLLLRDQLEKTGKYRVVMTRTDDTFIPLDDRVRIARERGGALFVSIHCDSIRRAEGDAQGATVYTLSERASDSEAARLADAENKADVIAGLDLRAEPNDVANILIDLAQRETKSLSTRFARNLVGELKSAIRLHREPVKSAGFKVLKSPDVPSVLLELGYISNKDDLKLLKSEAWRAKTVDSVVKSIDGFFNNRRLAGTVTAVEQP